MTPKPDPQARAAFEKIFAAHFTPEERDTIRTARTAALDEWKLLQPQLEAVMAAGDPTSPTARAVAMQCRTISLKMTGADKTFRERFGKFRDDVAQSPEAGSLMLVTPQMRDFVKRALAVN
jgi:hypothetical protein